MALKVGIFGATGKMGLELCSLLGPTYAVQGNILELAEAVARTNRLVSVEGCSIKTVENSPYAPVHVWIDFSQPEGTLALLECSKEPVVICTTGFSAAQLARIETCAKDRPVLLAPNTSPGIGLLVSMIETLPKLAELGFDIHLDETHHTMKKDKPSGTAKLIAAALTAKANEPSEIHSVRAGGEKGRHRITFTAQDEEITIEHRVFDRSVFARGALLAAAFLVKQGPGLYSMKDVWRNANV